MLISKIAVTTIQIISIIVEVIPTALPNSLMKIVKFKQKEFGGKFFIISHRDEIDNELVDNQYHVTIR